jgi:hypothetical protein
LLYSIVGCAGIGGPKAEWATAPDVDLPAFSTFDWADGPSGTPQTVLDSQVRNALRAELLKKGYEESPDAPDFLVSYEAVEHEMGQRSSPVTIGIGVGTWGRHVGGRVGTSVGVGGGGDPNLRYRLAIRAIDPDRSRELWVGATTTFELPPEARVIDRAVAGVMRGFPGKRN